MAGYVNRKRRFLKLKRVIHKAFAYITAQHHLLVFRHPYAPEAGIQVPAGTVEANERTEEAVLREAFEETGLRDLSLKCFLGEQKRDMTDFGRDEIHHRFFYHLQYHGHFVYTWQHEELYHSRPPSSKPHLFEFFWISLPHNGPPLIADHGIMLPQLMQVLASNSMHDTLT